MSKLAFATVLVAVVLSAGCRKNESVNSPANNTPVVANTVNAFTFDLAATAYSGTQQFTLSFTTDSLACSLTVAGHAAGSASLTVADSNYSTVYADSSLNNQVTAFTQAGKGIPKRVVMVFSGYTGTITFALARAH